MSESRKKSEIDKVPEKELTHSERFALSVEKHFKAGVGDIQLTPFQNKLIQNYFIKLDQVLKEAEQNRLRKSEEYRDPLPVTWGNVNMEKLYLDVVAFSAIGLDPCQDNHLSLIPYKNNASKKYNITLMIGYVGLELKAKKYGYDIPDVISTEIVYSTDKFKQFKKDKNTNTENYTFEITNDFDRGEIVGGFYYLEYLQNPEKNKIKVFSKKEIEKRKPKYAATEFWGGEKKKFNSDEVEKIEGWEDEMALKTIKRAAYKSIPIDSSKIDEHLLRIIETENDSVKEEVQHQISGNSNKETIGFENIEEAEIVEEQVNESVQQEQQSFEEEGPEF